MSAVPATAIMGAAAWMTPGVAATAITAVAATAITVVAATAIPAAVATAMAADGGTDFGGEEWIRADGQSRRSMFRELIEVADHQEFHGPFVLLQLEPEPLNRSEERRVGKEGRSR